MIFITCDVSFSSFVGISTRFPCEYFLIDLFPVVDVLIESFLIIENLLLF
jgi:hypothetical protein